MTGVADRHVQALIATAGKHIGALPGAKRLVARMRVADSPEDLSFLLQSLDLGLERAAKDRIVDAARSDATWREVHATLVRSAEQELTDQFNPSA